MKKKRRTKKKKRKRKKIIKTLMTLPGRKTEYVDEYFN